jgi:hypothetical protein
MLSVTFFVMPNGVNVVMLCFIVLNAVILNVVAPDSWTATPNVCRLDSVRPKEVEPPRQLFDQGDQIGQFFAKWANFGSSF